MIPLMKIGMVTGKTERQTASWLKRGWFSYLLILPDSYRLGDLLPADDPLDKYSDGDREDGEGCWRGDDSPICWYYQIITGLMISYLLMIPLMKIGMVTGKTEMQTASWLKRGWFSYLLILLDSYRLDDLLPADDPLDENRNGDREDGEADRQLVEERYSCEEVRSCQAFLLLK
jgi:hypothetical protein